MSLIAAVVLKNGEAGLWGDSIVTRTSPQNPHAGTTSHDERVQLRTNSEGNIEDYVEAACKVARFGDRTICGLTTDDTNFAFAILDLMEHEFTEPRNQDSLVEAARIAANTLSAPDNITTPSTTLFVLFFRLQQGIFYCKLQFDRNVAGPCTFNVNEFKLVELGQEWIDFSGSGQASLDLQAAGGLRNLADTCRPAATNVEDPGPHVGLR